MTISTTTRKAGPFNGNGVTTVFPFVFKVLAATDMQVTKTSTTGIDTVLILNSNYTVALNADQDASPGGNITYATLSAGEKLTVTSNMPTTQPADITSGSGFYASVIETALDRIVIAVQQALGLINRTIRFPVSDSFIPSDLPTATVRAGKALIFTSTGDVGLSSTPFDDQAAAAAASAAAAAASATQAGTAAGTATAGASTATTQAGIATSQASTATTQASNALTSANAAASLFDSFDDRYLGAKSADPTLDNDGAPLLDGALYFNNSTNAMRVYSLSLASWQPAPATVRYGSTIPASILGSDGDFYIRTGSWDLYGPKTSGAWPFATSMIGPNGPGTGNVLGAAASITDEVVLFMGTTGQQLKRATITGLAKLTSGVLSAASAATDYIVPGAVITRPLTMASARLLGRTTAAAGAVEEITVGSGLTFTGGTLDVVPPGQVLLATLTTTGSVNLDALNVFNSTYDNYRIVVTGLSPSATDTLRLQLANAGVVDTGSNYYSGDTGNSPMGSASTSVLMVSGTSIATNLSGYTAEFQINNVNSTTKTRAIFGGGAVQVAGSYLGVLRFGVYTAASTASGLRFSWTSGSTFQTGGSIKIYGLKN